jgi:hypothetical protein
MKFKTDFVTNSSCASFVIAKDKLTDLQIELIKNHIEAARMYSKNFVRENEYDPHTDFGYDDPWKITIMENSVCGETSMDNFDMMHFLLIIGVKEEDIQYEGCY